MPLDAAALAHSLGPLRGFADVRLVDDSGAQIPYLLERRNERLTVDLELRAAARSARRSRARQPLFLRDHPAVREPARAGRCRSRPPHADLPAVGAARRRTAAGSSSPRGDVRDAGPAPSGSTRSLDSAAAARARRCRSNRSRELLADRGRGGQPAAPDHPVSLLLPGWQLRFLRPAGPVRLFYGKDRPRRATLRRGAAGAIDDDGGGSGDCRGTGSSGGSARGASSRRGRSGSVWRVAVVLLLGVLVRLISSHRLRHLRHLVHDPQQIAAPDLPDLLLGVTTPHQFQRHVERLAGVVPSVHAAAAVEVRRDPDVIDADLLDDVVDVIDEVLDGGAW